MLRPGDWVTDGETVGVILEVVAHQPTQHQRHSRLVEVYVLWLPDLELDQPSLDDEVARSAANQDRY